MIKKILVFATLIFSFGIDRSFSQCSMYEVPLIQRINSSTAIFEGKVLSKTSFWNDGHTLIFTSNTIEVYKQFKGGNLGTQVQLITEGGTVNNDRHVVEPSLQLREDEIGIFFVEPSTVTNPNNTLGNTPFMAYASSQGFIKYNLYEKNANDPFKKYTNITTDLYDFIESTTNYHPLIISPFDINTGNNSNNSAQATQSIVSFSPTTITAGTASSITITGSGFGATRGTSVVQFKNADDGGATYITPAPAQYISWSNTSIVVQVPTGTGISGTAGTGTIQVVVSGTPTTSTGTLTISYAELNLDQSGTIYHTNHVNDNTTGGYTWQMFTTFDANANAKAAFTRAFGTWRCATFINWQLGTTTTINTIAQDGTNVIRFDIANELPVGVLGRCTSYWSSCATGVWYVTELDIAFDDATTWNYSTNQPTGSQSDFESVALHELGHGHQLTHVNNTLDVMNWALTQGTSRRVLNADDLAGGNDVMTRSIVSNSCGPTHMIALTSGNCAIGGATTAAAFTASDTTLCVGQCINFTDNSTNTPTGWSWTFTGAATTTSTTQSPTNICYNTAGSYAVSLTATNGGGSTTKTKTGYIVVTALPATPTITQSGSTLTSSVAVSYQWKLNGSPISGATAQSTVATVSGSYSVTVTNAGGCTATSTPTTFTVQPVAKFTASDSTVCVGQCISFTDNSTNTPTGWSWTFTGASTTTSTVQSPANICYNTPGSFAVALTATNGGGSNTKTKTGYITVTALPTAPTITQTGNTLTSSTATSYQWNLNGTPISGATLQSKTATTSGSYSVTITNAAGCLATSTPVTVTVTGIDNLTDDGTSVIIYPNPFSTSAVISVQSTNNTLQSSEISFILYDLVGKEVIRKDNINGSTQLYREQLSNGLYFYKVFHKQKLIGTGKVVIQ